MEIVLGSPFLRRTIGRFLKERTIVPPTPNGPKQFLDEQRALFSRRPRNTYPQLGAIFARRFVVFDGENAQPTLIRGCDFVEIVEGLCKGLVYSLLPEMFIPEEAPDAHAHVWDGRELVTYPRKEILPLFIVGADDLGFLGPVILQHNFLHQ